MAGVYVRYFSDYAVASKTMKRRFRLRSQEGCHNLEAYAEKST